MSAPFQRPPLNTSNSGSPLSPHPRGDTPVSFRPNVNRAKTKRWVEAKKYTYDGDDWGEDEYGEYEYDDEPPPVPQTQRPGANRSVSDFSSTVPKATSHPPLPSAERSRSMERVQTMPTERTTTSDSPTTPIVRPADIYKRMREEQTASQSPVELSAAPVGSETSGITVPIPVQAETTETSAGITPASANQVPTIALPEVKRTSGFGSSFFPESESNAQPSQDPASQSPQLQHNPSLGFRSAVNQAFDVPETPSTATDSVARSNSDSTTGVSPIFARHGTIDDRTPTIHEDPNENANTPTENDLVFKPGHRRDLSIPSPGNSPSRRPEIAGPDARASSELAQVTGVTSAETPSDPLHSSQQGAFDPDTPQPSSETPRWDLPAPLNVQTNMSSSPSVSNENIPVIVPTMSTETSPADTENDRLRKEIIRSLSRENSPSEHQDTPPQTGGQDSLFPREYGAYAAPQSADPQEPSLATVPPVAEAPIVEQPTPVPPHGAQPKLKKRFSWEESSSDDEPTPVPQEQPARPPPMPGQFPFSQDSVHPAAVAAPITQPSVESQRDIEGSDPEKLELAVVPPVAMESSSIQSSDLAPSPTTETLARAEEGETFLEHQPMEPAAKIPSGSMESGLLGFKDILGIQSPYGRIQAFDRTRDQFAAIDTGLSHWVQVTVHAHPEHADVVDRNSKPLSEEFRNSVPRNKFPKLASLGNLASSLQDGSSGSGHIRRPSAPLGSMRQPSGKDFLKNAGVLGGQAGKAAKGLFSKGRSKLKGSGTEKGFQATRGYHRPVRLSDLQPDIESDEDRDSVFPSSQPLGADRNADAEPTRGGQYFFVQPSVLTASGQSARQSAGQCQQRPAGCNNQDPCSIEAQGEPHQRASLRPSTQGEDAQSGAKPRVDSQDNSSLLNFQSRILQDAQSQSHPGALSPARLSVSSLGSHQPDLGPPQPLQKLEHHRSSSAQVSLVFSESKPSQPRDCDLGASDRRASSPGLIKLSESPLAREAIQTSPARRNGRPFSTPGLLSPSVFSSKHEWPRWPEQTSSRDPASQIITSSVSASPMERLKNSGRFRRISMGLSQPDVKPELSPKKRNIFTGLFTRTQHRNSAPPKPIESSSEDSTRHYLAPVSSRPDSRIASSSISSFDNHDRPVSLPDARNALRGRRAPVEGFFTHESPESFAAPKLHPNLNLSGPASASCDQLRLSDPTPNPIDPGRLSPHTPPHPSPATPGPQRQPHASSQRFSSPIPSPAPRTPPSRGRSEDRTYAQDLHLRSRSPKVFAPRPEERNLPKHDHTDPAFQLGTFRNSNVRTSHYGDQETPWKLTIPGDDDNETITNTSFSWRRETETILNGASAVTGIGTPTSAVASAGTRLPTYQEDEEEHGPSTHQPIDEKQSVTPPPHLQHPAIPATPIVIEPPAEQQSQSKSESNPNLDPTSVEHPHRSGARAINADDAPVELPVRTDDNSSEEIMMSSTAYPGQEWRPLGFSEWEHQ